MIKNTSQFGKMPTSRLVTGYIFRANNNPWVGGQVLFSLFPGTYTVGGIQYPKSTVAATTNESGYFETILFCNEEGEEPSYYTCTEPSGEISRWVLPVGVAPIDLSILKQAGLTRGDPQYQTLLSYVDARIQAQINGTFVKVPFAWGDVSPKILNTAFTGTIRTVDITIEIPFDGTVSDFYLGDSSDPQSLVPAGTVDGYTKAEYQFAPVGVYELPTEILFTIQLGGEVTQGKGTIILGV